MTTETIDRAATVAAPEPTDPLARASLELLAEYRTAANARADAERALERHLSPGAMQAWRDVSDAYVDANGAANDLHVVELARHLPGFGPTIRLLWAHVIDCRFENVGACCTTGPVEP